MSSGLLSKLRRTSPSQILTLVRRCGLVGLMKSLYYSLRYTGRPATLLVGRRSSVGIGRGATVVVESTFQLNIHHTSTIHPVLGGSRLHVGAGGSFRTSGDPWVGPGTVLNVSGDFTIGDSFINGLSRVHCFNEIRIGNGCAISWGVDILDSNSHQILVDGEWQPVDAPVIIGDDVWIGQGATILPGVEIGDGAVVAADAVVAIDVPPATLVAGCPAKVVRSDVEWR